MVRRWLSLLTVVGLIFVGLGTAAVANQSDEQGFLDKINSTRANAGLAPLQMDTGLRNYARIHTEYMIDGKCPNGDTICHSTSEALINAAGHGWDALGENVGRGGTVDSLHTAFMNSAGHKKNILGNWNYVGIGADHGPEGHLYVTVVFMKKGTTGAQTTTTTTPKPPTTKATTTTTTTMPTTTTTTLPPTTTTTTTLVVGPDRPVTPGGTCALVTRFGWICPD